jgi:SAM-dependent methyltransferase
MSPENSDSSQICDWESLYQGGGELPWDDKNPAVELRQYFDAPQAGLKPQVVLEIGCGSGTNAIWLAQQGCVVTATEIAPTAVETARRRAQQAGVSVNFCLADICQARPVAAASQDFAFDREVYHVIPAFLRPAFVKSMAQSLKRGAHWLSLAGNKDEERDDPEVGPPQMTAVELLEHIEPFFEVIKLERSSFVIDSGRTYLAWKALYRRR